jgi:hypothetical protein
MTETTKGYLRELLSTKLGWAVILRGAVLFNKELRAVLLEVRVGTAHHVILQSKRGSIDDNPGVVWATNLTPGSECNPRWRSWTRRARSWARTLHSCPTARH